MTYSRVKKYQELRDGLKDEVAISKENRQEITSRGRRWFFIFYEKR